MIDVQEILFPQIGRCTEEELYFRKIKSGRPEGLADSDYGFVKALLHLENQRKVDYHRTAGQLCIKEGGKVWFDTYFNGFSMGKWKKYTVLSGLSLRLKLSGRVKVTLCAQEKIVHDVITTLLAEHVVEAVPSRETEAKGKLGENRESGASEIREFIFEYPPGTEKTMYSFTLEALSPEAVFYGGSYVGHVSEEQRRQVKLAVGICTFRREAFVEKNLRILRESILENPACPLSGHLEVFVADNGKTLDVERLGAEHIHIFPNRNLGGAGGFTRDLIEMSDRKEDLGLTHVLLMDDDIVIEPASLVKTWHILSLLKEEYAEAFVGGAMLRLDQQSIQVESGASWNGGQLNSLKCGFDLRYLSSCLHNEMEEYTEFNAWWYCCFPLSIVREDNLPLPIFIRGDDLEYGLRNMKHLILMNGICVWHEPFENKYSSFLEYYIVRNQLIDNAFHCPWYGEAHLKKALWKHCKEEIMFYRYKNVDLYIRGVEDFLKGPRWLMEQDGEALHKKIMAAGYKAVELQELDMPFHFAEFEESLRTPDTKKARLKRIFTLNGLLLPPKGQAIVPVSALRSVMFYRKKRVMHYDASAHKAFVTERSVGETWRCIREVIRINGEISDKMSEAQKAYREEGRKLRELEFWWKYLGLNL